MLPRRVAVFSVHTSPLDQPGAGDAGGLNVYVAETARRLARRGIAVEVFTRATSAAQPPTVRLDDGIDGVEVHHVVAGPYDGLDKADLPAQLCAFSAAVLRAAAAREPGWYGLVHSHYWLSGQVGWLARDRWGVPLVHSAHTLGRVKNAALADGDAPEPAVRLIGEDQVVAEADRLVAATRDEARELIDLYAADPGKVSVVPPGVDLETFGPGDRRAERRRLGIPLDAAHLLFVGRLQPLKAPDVLVRAAGELRRDPRLAGRRLVVSVLGAPSGSGLADPDALGRLARELGVDDIVRVHAPVDRPTLAAWYRSADLTVVPSYSESFGLVALESQACGTPVVAAEVGGLTTAVADGVSGVLVSGHSAHDWAAVLSGLLTDPGRLRTLADAAPAQARQFSWDVTVDGLLAVYGEAMAARRAESAAS